jgi:hypothetical protein
MAASEDTEYDYPEQASKNLNRSIRKRAENIKVVNGDLMYVKKKGPEVRIVRSTEEQKSILRMCHSDPTSGHFGVKKTINRIRERFYWKGLYRDAEDVVLKCHQCQMMNKKISTARPELHPIPVQSPWYHLGIDFIGPYHLASSKGNKYVLTVCDYFTKFVWVRALPSKEAKTVVQSLKELFLLFGIPNVITTDQGTEFKNSFNKEFPSRCERLTTTKNSIRL